MSTAGYLANSVTRCNKKIVMLLATATTIVALSAAQTCAQPADGVFRDGVIWTFDADRPRQSHRQATELSMSASWPISSYSPNKVLQMNRDRIKVMIVLMAIVAGKVVFEK